MVKEENVKDNCKFGSDPYVVIILTVSSKRLLSPYKIILKTLNI